MLFAKITPSPDCDGMAVGGRAALSALPHELDKEGAGRLAIELSDLRRSGVILDLDDDLTALAELARFCARARGGAWLTVS